MVVNAGGLKYRRPSRLFLYCLKIVLGIGDATEYLFLYTWFKKKRYAT